jgi:hypothetical protein
LFRWEEDEQVKKKKEESDEITVNEAEVFDDDGRVPHTRTAVKKKMLQHTTDLNFSHHHRINTTNAGHLLRPSSYVYHQTSIITFGFNTKQTIHNECERR